MIPELLAIHPARHGRIATWLLPASGNRAMPRGSRASAPSNTSGSGSSLGLGLHIGIAVLRDDGVDALGTSQRESESHWRAVIKHVNREALETD